eukprot:2696317-Pyramimonas_sp.AAC.1
MPTLVEATALATLPEQPTCVTPMEFTCCTCRQKKPWDQRSNVRGENPITEISQQLRCKPCAAFKKR